MRKVLIIDDHTIVREGFKLLLETTGWFSLIDESNDGLDALLKCEAESYDLMLLDLHMPRLGGIRFLEEKKKRGIGGKVIVVTSFDDPMSLSKLVHHTIHGYLLKDTSKDSLLDTIHDVLEGRQTKSVWMNDRARMNQSVGQDTTGLFQTLTDREWEVLKEIIKGITSKEIACTMKVSERTIKAHLTSIYQKLGVNSRTEATALVLNAQREK